MDGQAQRLVAPRNDDERATGAPLAELNRRKTLEILPTWVWLVVAGAVAVFLVGLWLGRRGRGSAVSSEIEKVKDAERDLRATREETAERYAQHIDDALRLLEQAISRKVPGDVTLTDFVTQGLFEPAQGALAETGTRGEVRFSVLRAENDVFNMTIALGQGLDSRKAYELPVKDSFAGLALNSQEVEWSNDLKNDPRYKPHPKAKPEREYQSMVCVPLKHANQANHVLAVIATEKEAFSAADRIYLKTLTRIADVAWATILANQRGDERRAS